MPATTVVPDRTSSPGDLGIGSARVNTFVLKITHNDRDEAWSVWLTWPFATRWAT